MRVALSVDDNNGLDSVVSAHFGRCPFYALVDLDGCEVQQTTIVDNPNYGQHAPGMVPRFIRQQSADVMVAGGMGRRAIDLFQQFGIQAVTGAAGTVRHALEQYLNKTLQSAEPCLTSSRHDDASSTGYEKDALGRLREETELLASQLDTTIKRLQQLSND